LYWPFKPRRKRQMRIGRLFKVSMLSVTGLAVILGAEIFIPQARTYADKTEAIKAVNAYGAVLATSQQVTSLRAPYLSPLVQEAPATPVQLEAIANAVKLVDAALANARAMVSALDDGAVIAEGLDRAAAKIAEVRATTDRALTVPMSARESGAVKGFQPG